MKSALGTGLQHLISQNAGEADIHVLAGCCKSYIEHDTPKCSGVRGTHTSDKTSNTAALTSEVPGATVTPSVGTFTTFSFQFGEFRADTGIMFSKQLWECCWFRFEPLQRIAGYLLPISKVLCVQRFKQHDLSGAFFFV